MERLPLEILQTIFGLLHQQEKVECMLTCQHWANVIKSSNLFETIQLSEMSNWNGLIERLRNEPSQRSQVELLILDFYVDGDFNYDLISSFFPRLRFLYVLGCHNFQVRTNCSGQQLENKHIQYIAEALSHELTCSILSSGLCSKLKILIIRASKRHTSSHSVIALLNNAPNLSELSLESFTVSFDNLELLHRLLPTSLISIKLTTPILGEEVLSTEIEPAISVTTFFLENFNTSILLQREWLHYINTKYVNVSNLKIRDPIPWHNQGTPINDRIVRNVDRFGSQIKSLSIQISNCGPDLFRILDDAGCQIENLDISLKSQATSLSALLRSNQTRYIHTLKMDGVEPNDFDWLKEFPVLKELTLIARLHGRNESNRGGSGEDKEGIELTKILNICGYKVESLNVYCGRVNIDIDSICVYTSIKRLSFFNQTLPDHMDYFLSTSCPNLHDLSLLHCKLGGKTFNLPNHHLSCVVIAESVVCKETYLLLLTRKEQRWYTAKQRFSDYNLFKKQFSLIKTMSPYLAAKSMIYDETWDEPPTVVFKCASVSKLLVLR